MAVHPDFRKTGGAILFPLMKFMYEYCTTFFDTRHLVIAVHPTRIEMYESLLFFKWLIEKEVAIFVHELHQWKQDCTARFSKVRMHRQGRYLRNFSSALPDFLQVENCLQGKSKNTLANQRKRSDNLSVKFGAKRCCRRERVIDRCAHPGRGRFHESAAYIGVMQQCETGLEFLTGLGNFQH